MLTRAIRNKPRQDSRLIYISVFSMLALIKGLKSFQFWCDLSEQEFDALYSLSIPTPERVIGLLESDPQSPHESKILSWLHRYLRSTTILRKFLQFVTGTDSLHKPGNINVKFFSSNAAEPMPRPQTCFRILNVPKNYTSLTQLTDMFDAALKNPEAWQVEDEEPIVVND